MKRWESARSGGRGLSEIKVRGRAYRILDDVGRGGRTRLQVEDRAAGPRGDFRQILVLPRGRTSRQHIAVLQRLSQGNPNLPTVLDYEERDDQIYLVTNWVRGEDLKTYFEKITSDKRQWPSPLTTMKLFRGLAHGLCQMHHYHRVVHGDIKPANLVLTTGPERLVMIDFGSAWTAEHTVRRELGDGTTPRYAAPEQLREQPDVDPRSDQFSAAVVAYKMLTGVLPYGEMGGKAGLAQYRPTYEPLYEPPSDLCPVRQVIPRRIWRLVDDAIGTSLRLDPDKRFDGRQPWLEALEDVHCEMRRKGRLTKVDSVLLQWIRWMGDRTFNRVRR